MEHSTKEDGMTFGELCRIVLKRIWYILGVSVLVAVIAALVFAFGITPNKKTYSLEFTVSYPSGETMKYPDGSPFHYRDLISVPVLEEAKATDARFAKIDVSTLLNEDAIEISATTQEVNSSSQFTGTYTITVKGSFFASKTIATDFIRAVANVPINRVKTLASEIDFLLDLTVFSSASFEDRIELLAQQKKELLAQYDEWISLYRENYFAAEKTLKNHKAEVAVLFSETTQTQILQELTNCGYVPAESVQEKVNALNEEKELNSKKITAIVDVLKELNVTGTESEGGGATVNAYAYSETESGDSQTVVSVTTANTLSTLLAQLVERNEQIDYQIAKITDDGTWSGENVAQFEARLMAEFEKLNTAAEMMKTVSGAIYAQQSTVIFASSKATEDGGTSPVLAAVAGFIVAFLIAAAIFGIADMNKNKKENGAAAPEQQTPAEPTEENTDQKNEI